jgi:hypothetical protein
LDLSISGKAAPKIVPPYLRIPCWKGLSANSEEKRVLASDQLFWWIMKALDPNRPIREADIRCRREFWKATS